MDSELEKHSKLCPVRKALAILGSKWVFIIIMELDKPCRFNDLKRSITDISEKVLIDKLKTLEQAKFITRKDFKTIPPKVEYALTDRGREVLKLIPQLTKIGKELS